MRRSEWRSELITETGVGDLTGTWSVAHRWLQSHSGGVVYDRVKPPWWITGKVCQGHHIFRVYSQTASLSLATESGPKRYREKEIDLLTGYCIALRQLVRKSVAQDFVSKWYCADLGIKAKAVGFRKCLFYWIALLKSTEGPCERVLC